MTDHPSTQLSPTPNEITTLGGGCFWCIETVFNQLEGVASAISGYMGGATLNPTYKDICSGETGHAEVVQVTFDPAVVTFKEILEIFFTLHDPTTLNCQGNDRGTQYRSAIFFHTPEQQIVAEKTITELSAMHLWPDPIVTEITPAKIFYPAEDYHQAYFQQNETQPYCQFVVAPKVIKFREKFKARLKAGV